MNVLGLRKFKLIDEGGREWTRNRNRKMKYGGRERRREWRSEIEMEEGRDRGREGGLFHFIDGLTRR